MMSKNQEITKIVRLKGGNVALRAFDFDITRVQRDHGTAKMVSNKLPCLLEYVVDLLFTKQYFTNPTLEDLSYQIRLSRTLSTILCIVLH